MWCAFVHFDPTDSVFIGDAYAAYRQNPSNGMTGLMDGSAYSRTPTEIHLLNSHSQFGIDYMCDKHINKAR